MAVRMFCDLCDDVIADSAVYYSVESSQRNVDRDNRYGNDLLLLESGSRVKAVFSYQMIHEGCYKKFLTLIQNLMASRV